MSTIYFLGGWLPPFDWHFLIYTRIYMVYALKVIILLFVFLWVRATLPRYRYDQLMTRVGSYFFPYLYFGL